MLFTGVGTAPGQGHGRPNHGITLGDSIAARGAMNEPSTSKTKTSSLARLPGDIWALGLVSMMMDISSEMIHGLLPVFLTSVLGAGTEVVGLIEGVGEATASISKLFSGWL